MKRKSLNDADCPIARSLDQVGEWWSLLIIRDVAMGKRRFGELLDNLGVARNILSTRLKRLISCGVLETRPQRGPGHYQEYELTEKGGDLLVVLVELENWGRRWAPPHDGQSSLSDADEPLEGRQAEASIGLGQSQARA